MSALPAAAHRGGCLCGAVRFEVRGKLRPIAFCHCGQCRRQTGLYYAATAAPEADITMENSNAVSWYAASAEAKRGFCATCGSALFWRVNEADRISILAGAFDDGTDLQADRHIHVASKPDWYEIGDALPRYSESD